MLTMKTSYISHVVLLELKCVSRDRSMQGNLLKFNRNQLGTVSAYVMNSVSSGRIKKRAAHSENFLGRLVCTGNLAFRLQ